MSEKMVPAEALLLLTGEDVLSFVQPPVGAGVATRAANAAWYERVTGRLVDPLPGDATAREWWVDFARGLGGLVLTSPSWPRQPEGIAMPVLPLRVATPALAYDVRGRRLRRLGLNREWAFLWDARFGPDAPPGSEVEIAPDGGLVHHAWACPALRIDGPEPIPAEAICVGMGYGWNWRSAEILYYHPGFAEVPFGAEIPLTRYQLDWTGRIVTTAVEWNRERRGV